MAITNNSKWVAVCVNVGCERTDTSKCCIRWAHVTAPFFQTLPITFKYVAGYKTPSINKKAKHVSLARPSKSLDSTHHDCNEKT
jgi:hypothetical protein